VFSVGLGDVAVFLSFLSEFFLGGGVIFFKIVTNAALGFDTYLVVRYGARASHPDDDRNRLSVIL